IRDSDRRHDEGCARTAGRQDRGTRRESAELGGPPRATRETLAQKKTLERKCGRRKRARRRVRPRMDPSKSACPAPDSAIATSTAPRIVRALAVRPCGGQAWLVLRAVLLGGDHDMCRTEGHPAMKRAAFVCCGVFGVMGVFGIPSADAQGLEQDGKAMSSAAHLELAESRRAPTSFKVVTAGYLGRSAGDFYLSNRCIQAGRCVEVGAYRGVAMHPLAFGLTKMAASSA